MTVSNSSICNSPKLETMSLHRCIVKETGTSTPKKSDSAILKGKLLIYVTPLMDLEGSTLSERN